ncbi:MAG TPA: GNAT family N-acetyltransferase [Xanthomonadaceae bacterium]|nr:GNAT family N-acetyltransferase [Xanthomonadaceae bacterium]
MNESGLQVRRATDADRQPLARLFDGYRVFYGQPSDPERALRFIQERFRQGDSVILLACIDAAAVGFVQLYPMHSSVLTDRVWVLNDLFVDPPSRALGAGRALLEAARAFGEADGALRLQLETRRTNTVAQALYTELGWQVEDETVWYQLPLRG